MPSRLVVALLGLALVAPARADEPAVPRPQGWVTDLAHAIDAGTAARIGRLVDELREKTAAEIAIVTVETTAPYDDFTYAMRIADAWHPGRKGEDNGVVFLVATRDRKVRILVGYGLEGILPDGLVGEIIDRVVVPAFRSGDVAGGVERGVQELARRIAASRGVELTGAPPRRIAPAPTQQLPRWAVLLLAILFAGFMVYQLANQSNVDRRRGGGFFPPWYGGFGGGYGGGGFGGGGGGFGGFGGGGFGGGGAGRSW